MCVPCFRATWLLRGRASHDEIAEVCIGCVVVCPDGGGAAPCIGPGEFDLDAVKTDADLDKLMHGDVSVETRLSSEQSSSLLALLGLDGAIAARAGPGQLQGSVTGAWGTPLRLKLNLTGAGFDAVLLVVPLAVVRWPMPVQSSNRVTPSARASTKNISWRSSSS